MDRHYNGSPETLVCICVEIGDKKDSTGNSGDTIPN